MEKSNIVIIGNSIAGYNVAKSLVKNNSNVNITLIDEGGSLPYDRSKLSKDWMANTEKSSAPLFKQKDFFDEHKIVSKLNTKITELNSQDKYVTAENGSQIDYDKLVIATGSSLRQLDAENIDANDIFYLRSYADALKIKERIQHVNDIALVGGGFIGLELAATFATLGKNVTVIEYAEHPLGRILGDQASAYFVKMHKEHGVKFVTGEGVKRFEKNSDGDVTAVITDHDTKIDTQLAVVGVGAVPNVPFDNADLKTDRGGIVVNEYGETSLPDVYAAGDCTIWPYQDSMIHVEHWEHARAQARVVAENLIQPESKIYKVRPYFWTDEYDQTFEYLGNALTWADIVIRGNLNDRKFTIAYVDENDIPIAILFANNSENRDDVEALMDQNKPLNRSAFKDVSVKLLDV